MSQCPFLSFFFLSLFEIGIYYYTVACWFGCGRQELQRRYERVLLLDMDVANQRTVEQQLWRSVYYNVIEGLRRQQAPDNSSGAASNKEALTEILDEVGVMFVWQAFPWTRFYSPPTTNGSFRPTSFLCHTNTGGNSHQLSWFLQCTATLLFLASDLIGFIGYMCVHSIQRFLLFLKSG